MKYALVNDGSEADPSAFPLLATALKAFAQGFAADNEFDASQEEVEAFPTLASVPDGWTRTLVKQTLDVDGALAYHDRDEKGNPIIYAGYGAVPGGELFHGKSGTGDSLLGELQHEIAEARLDMYCNLYADITVIDPNTGEMFRSVAVEAEDPVQETCDTFDVQGTKCDRTNYVLAAYFNGLAPKGTRVDRIGVLSAPGTLAAGGYIIGRKVIAQDGQLFGKCVKIEHRVPMARWRANKKAHKSSRTQRRLSQLVRLGTL